MNQNKSNQSLNGEGFLDSLLSERPSVDNCSNMGEIRQEIDFLDDILIELLGRRMALIKQASIIKKEQSLPALIEKRVEEVISNVRDKAKDVGFDEDKAEKIWRFIIELSIKEEEEFLNKQNNINNS